MNSLSDVLSELAYQRRLKVDVEGYLVCFYQTEVLLLIFLSEVFPLSSLGISL